MSTPLTPLEQTQHNIEEIKQAMLSGENAKIPGVLREIKSILLANPNTVTLLAPEDIAKIIAGIFVQTGTVMAPAVKKAAKSDAAKAKAAASKLTLEDL